MKASTLLLVMAAAAADGPRAKTIFYDPTSDVEIKDNGPAVRKPARPPVTGAGNTATGLMYTIELQTPDGKMAMVPSNHIFHTGDRIRLHIRSNVDGRLVVMQSQEQAPYRLLFPPNPETDNRVKKLADNVFPKKFFRFDQNPGDLTLMLMLTADGATPNMVAVTVPTRVTAAPQKPPAENPTSVQPVRNPAPSTGGSPDLRAQYDAQVRAEYEKLKGSKALVMEDDTTGPDPSTTVVSVPWRDSNITPGVLVVSVKLKQQP